MRIAFCGRHYCWYPEIKFVQELSNVLVYLFSLGLKLCLGMEACFGKELKLGRGRDRVLGGKVCS